MSETFIAPPELELARYLAECRYEYQRTPWRFHGLPIPEDELEAREYDHETERLRRFIRGQQITNPEGKAA